ncbi:hypothetical protein [Actinoplanes sp. GCM10030250]|uniref:hypothetical protein n=1 Tax=Actinoplanes sp. GCM10030250 TaxID=3273376 RepID=UPI0036131FED
MTNLEIIVKALAVGNTAAAENAQLELRNALRERLPGRPRAHQALEAVETDPGVWQTRLGADVAEAGADRDEQVIAAAQRVLAAVKPAARYTVDVRDSKGVQVGDHNTQHNTFS